MVELSLAGHPLGLASSLRWVMNRRLQWGRTTPRCADASPPTTHRSAATLSLHQAAVVRDSTRRLLAPAANPSRHQIATPRGQPHHPQALEPKHAHLQPLQPAIACGPPCPHDVRLRYAIRLPRAARCLCPNRPPRAIGCPRAHQPRRRLGQQSRRPLCLATPLPHPMWTMRLAAMLPGLSKAPSLCASSRGLLPAPCRQS